MQKYVILKLTLAIIFLTISTVQAADYAALKNEYIQNHPGQTIIPFPWETSTSVKVLPFNYNIPAAPANNISITASRGQFESGSFIITAQKDLAGIGISVPNLQSAQGNNIPATAVNVRLVKVWYQSGEDFKYTKPAGILTPELLLKDDSLVKVDYENRINYLKVTINGTKQYIDISDPAAAFPSNAQIHDTPSLQPFSLKANENKQIWLTIHVPEGTPAGDYSGDITITSSSDIPVIMNVHVTVLPFDLDPAPIEYAIYYTGYLASWTIDGIQSNYKIPAQYSIELQNIKEHGVSYPTIYQTDDLTKLDTALSLRRQSGLPLDHIYFVSSSSTASLTGNSTSESDLIALKTLVTTYTNKAQQYGFEDVYFYGLDEAKGSELASQRPAWEAVHQAGGKVFVACYDDAVGIVGDLLDIAVHNGPLNQTQAERWHSNGKKILSYANPQVSMENPEIYRKNYGFALWNAGYDGEMVFAYEYGFGHIWKDFENTYFRDHAFAYPTSDGVIDTIQWEGFREGVDDTRYLATLIKKEGSNTSARALISDSLSKGEDMVTIREKVIQQILISQTPSPIPPTAQFNASTNQGKAPLTVQFTDQSVSMGTTTYKWNINNDAVVDYTIKNPVHTYQTAGNYTVNFTVTNASGSDSEIKTNYIKVSAPDIKAPPLDQQLKVGTFNGVWSLDYNGNGTWEGPAIDKTFKFGGAEDTPVVGNWQGNGTDGIAIFRPSTGYWYFDYNLDGIVDKSFRYGGSDDQIIAGDWQGTGADGIAIFRPSTGYWYFDDNLDGVVDKSFRYGGSDDRIIKGDWDGDGKDGIAIFRPSTGYWYLDYNLDGVVDKSFRYGGTDDQIVAGDWQGTGSDGIAIFRPSTGYWYLDYNLDGVVDKSFRYGGTDDQIVAGDWQGTGSDGIAIFRPLTGYWYLDYDTNGAVDKAFKFGTAGNVPVVGVWN